MALADAGSCPELPFLLTLFTFSPPIYPFDQLQIRVFSAGELHEAIELALKGAKVCSVTEQIWRHGPGRCNIK